ncbi:MAG TPA: mechanosensitive ion channel family protein [Thiotrichaceae bacterium]|jgi:MscS family membrane protein|nr:mechanosensitive ion channel family protein [Thiotrichaceae bacterium]HIM07428.1 mechanosensitive ion channel family protein [Gammaproteobacteria bacterium]
MTVSEIMDSALSFFGKEAWVVQVFIVVLVTVFFNWMQKRILSRVFNKLQRTGTYWDDALLDAVRKPLTFFIWIIGLTFAADIVKNETDAAIFGAIEPIREVGVIFVLSWFIVRFISRVEKNILDKKNKAGEEFDKTTADAIAKLLRISVIITSALVVMQTLGYSVSGVLAFGGIGGIAIGFAARDLLANFFGGLMIYMDRPFDVGDWIRSSDREIEGTVEKIGWRLTTIRTFNKRPLYVPNAVFANIAVENPSRMTNRRIKETIGIRYDDVSKMKDIISDVKKMLKEHDEIDANQTLIVNFNEFAPSSLDFFIYTFTKTTNWIKFHEVKQDVLLKVIGIVESHGAECAFPTSTLHIPQEVQLSNS